MGPATAGQARIAELVEPLRFDPAGAAVLCDIDGTLAPIVADPGAVAVPSATRDLLTAIADRYALTACVTGRRAAEARRIVGLKDVTYVGNHGFEILAADAEDPAPDPALAGRAEIARNFLGTLDANRLAAAGVRAEDKGAIQALHWRGAEIEEAARMLVKEAASLAQAAGLVPRWGRKVLEIRPVAGIDKGSATLRLVRESGVAHALFGGDDLTDLDAFRSLRWLAESGRLQTAACVGVTSEEAPDELASRSDVLVDGTEGFVGVLAELAR
jgi:trehalose 6-phosphate phosphatase